jgi:hypothetical protein
MLLKRTARLLVVESGTRRFGVRPDPDFADGLPLGRNGHIFARLIQCSSI